MFPQAVLLSGTQAELLLVGTSGPRLEIDPARCSTRSIAHRPCAPTSPGSTSASRARSSGRSSARAATLAAATRASPPVSDDRPIQEYGVLSGLSTGLHGVPASLFDLSAVASWCPRCFDSGRPVAAVADLDAYMGLLREAYEAPVTAVAAAAARRGPRRVLGSRYLGTVLPDTAEVYNIVGAAERRQGRVEPAVHAFEAALRLEPASPAARQNLGQIRHEQGRALLEARRFLAAAAELREAITRCCRRRPPRITISASRSRR